MPSLKQFVKAASAIQRGAVVSLRQEIPRRGPPFEVTVERFDGVCIQSAAGEFNIIEGYALLAVNGIRFSYSTGVVSP